MSLACIRLFGTEVTRHLRHSAISEFDDAANDIIENFASEIEREIGQNLKPQRWNAEPVRGLRFLPSVYNMMKNNTTPLNALASRMIPEAAWSEFYAETDWTRDFLSSFATGDLIGPSGSYASDRLILGLFLMGPDTFYPVHAHPAEEFYLVIGGEADFQNGAQSEFESKKPGDVILHQSNTGHAIRTGPSALFAVYGWRGALDLPSWYSPQMNETDSDKNFPPFKRPTAD